MSKFVSAREIAQAIDALNTGNTIATLKEVKKQLNRARQGTRMPLTGFEQASHGCAMAVDQGFILLEGGRYMLTETGKQEADTHKADTSAAKVPEEAQAA